MRHTDALVLRWANTCQPSLVSLFVLVRIKPRATTTRRTLMSMQTSLRALHPIPCAHSFLLSARLETSAVVLLVD
tara:strand:- start:1377 stop:1601 length:225 start_codon:yes stop_codon:yes gene_type:complete